ncbi:MAG: aromatic-ring-hydroxylating dioxygenase subunit beta [Lautropia sp.]
MQPKNVDEALGASVLIEGVESMTGADSIAPNHRGRGPDAQRLYVPAAHPGGAPDAALRHEVETLLTRQAALLDAKRWAEWIALFDEQGLYWMPVEPAQSDWLGEPSIFSEDRLLMEIRMGRLEHPNAWSQAPRWGTNHLVGNILIEASDAAGAAALPAPCVHADMLRDCIVVYSRFQVMELRREQVRHFGGTYRHWLVRTPDGLRIRLQRVDLMNGQAEYDYVIQAWV